MSPFEYSDIIIRRRISAKFETNVIRLQSTDSINLRSFDKRRSQNSDTVIYQSPNFLNDFLSSLLYYFQLIYLYGQINHEFLKII